MGDVFLSFVERCYCVSSVETIYLYLRITTLVKMKMGQKKKKKNLNLVEASILMPLLAGLRGE